MKISGLAALADAEMVQGDFKDRELSGGYTSDLLSDVMAHAMAGEALVTIQAHKNTVAVASLVGAPAIVICNSRPVPDDMVEAARQEGIALILSPLCQYQVSGRLWNAMRS